MVKRFDVYLINLDSEPSEDAKNTRPGVIVSPDEANQHLEHVLIAPLSSGSMRYPTRVPAKFLNSERFIVLDQIRAVDKTRLVKNIGTIEKRERKAVIETLVEMFAE